MNLEPYFSLMRLNNLVGLWLALFPSLSGILLASTSLSWQTFFYIIIFTAGTFLMRPAGCIINDIFDKEIDSYVKRTKYRPLASGSLSIKKALFVLLVLLLLALIILLLTNKVTLILGIICICMVIVYPLLKRYVWWPQFFLGLTFNMGALMGYSAIKNHIGIESIFFYIGCVFWTLCYDTIYAHQDKQDDEKIGLKSTAIYFGDNTKFWLKKFYIISCTMWLYAGILSSLQNVFYLALVAIGFIFYHQYKNFNPDSPTQCMYIFKNNSYIGLICFCGTLLDRIIN